MFQRLESRAFCVLFAIVFFSACQVTANPSIEFSYGLDHQIMRHRFMPLQVTISGLGSPIEGSIVVRQTRGTVDDDQFPVTHTIASGTIDNRTYRATIPNLEPLNPLTVELVGSEGEHLVLSEQIPRFGIREWSFPLIVNDQLLVNRTEPLVDPSELPTDWWAYDAVDCVWLMAPIVSTPMLEALGEWVVSGGSLAIFTGAEFPRMDSPNFRKLLPISEPTLTETSDGLYVLEGLQKGQASVHLERNGIPLLVKMPLGAGSISLVTIRYEDLSVEEFEQIHERIDSAIRMPNIEKVLQEALRATPVPRPPYWMTGALLGVILTGLLVFSETRYRLERNKRMRTFVGVFVALCTMTIFTTVWSWEYASRHSDRVDVYQTDTTIRVQSAFGLHIALSTLFATQQTDARVDHPSASYPLPSTVLAVRDIDFSEENNDSLSVFALQKNERRDLTFVDQGRLDVTMQVTSVGIEITNRTTDELQDAFVLFGSETYYVPTIQEGTATYDLTNSYLPGERSTIPTALLSWFPMRSGATPWLLLMDQDDEEVLADFEDKGIRKQVRRVVVTIIEGESR